MGFGINFECCCDGGSSSGGDPPVKPCFCWAPNIGNKCECSLSDLGPEGPWQRDAQVNISNPPTNNNVNEWCTGWGDFGCNDPGVGPGCPDFSGSYVLEPNQERAFIAVSLRCATELICPTTRVCGPGGEFKQRLWFEQLMWMKYTCDVPGARGPDGRIFSRHKIEVWIESNATINARYCCLTYGTWDGNPSGAPGEADPCLGYDLGPLPYSIGITEIDPGWVSAWFTHWNGPDTYKVELKQCNSVLKYYYDPEFCTTDCNLIIPTCSCWKVGALEPSVAFGSNPSSGLENCSADSYIIEGVVI